MSGFASVAKSLLVQKHLQTGPKVGNSVAEKLDHIEVMSNAGFSPEHIFRDLRELYNECGDEEKSIKFQIQKLMIQVHGMLSSDETQRIAPTFVLNIQGDNARVNTMLCPNVVNQ